jgi:hypothetical protein
VGPFAVHVGAVPALPLLAALPGGRPPTLLGAALVAVPVMHGLGTSLRHATSIARRSRGVVAPHTPWQSPTSSAQARHAPWTSQVRHSATAASAGSLGAGKNVSGSTV